MGNRYSYDVVVIGGGAGGLFTASVTNALGARTCIIEKKKLGGDCTHYGCVPSKSILKSAETAQLIRTAQDYGIKIRPGSDVDTGSVFNHVRDVIDRIAAHHRPEDLEARGIKVIFGSPGFLNKNTLHVNGRDISLKRAIICTGSHPAVPPIDGLKDIDYLTNETVFDLEKVPESIIVLGGGPIGVELSQALARLGAKVLIVEMLDRILFKEDPELVEFIGKALKSENIRIETGKKAVRCLKENGNLSVILSDKDGKEEKHTAQKILVAVGRIPNTDGLDLKKGAIEYDKKGITVNDYLQTTNKNVFACGDVTGGYQFSHVAAYQGGVCARNALFKKIVWQKVNYENIAWGIFTHPELARLGLTEEEAREGYGKIKVYKNPYAKSDRAVTDLEEEGLIKIIADKKGRVLGAHVVGAHAGEVIQGLLVAKAKGVALDKLARMLYIYPTFSELVKKTAALALVEKGNGALVKFFLKLFKRV